MYTIKNLSFDISVDKIIIEVYLCLEFFLLLNFTVVTLKLYQKTYLQEMCNSNNNNTVRKSTGIKNVRSTL